MKIKQRKLRAAAEIGYSCLMLLVGTALPIYLLKKTPPASNACVLAVELIAGGGLALQFLIYLTKSSKQPQGYYLVGFAVALPLVIIALS